MAAVELHGVTKRFGEQIAVANVDLAIGDGEFVVLVGPSGCGKSTTLRMIAGLESATEGEIRIGGYRVNEIPPGKRNLAMVFQSYALYPHMTVAENMGFSLRCRGYDKSRIAAEVRNAAEILGLTTMLERRPAELSGGQRQRVALGRAMVRQPEAFLFDEPLSNLDAALRAHMRIELRQLRDRMGTTSIYVTHDQIEAMTLGDRIVVMHDGHIMQSGEPLDVYEWPNSRFVGGFLGSPPMNFLEVRGAPDEDPAILLGSVRIPLDAAWSAAIRSAAGSPMTLGIRPEHLVTLGSGESAPAGAHTISGRVVLTEQHGGELLAEIETECGVLKIARIPPDTRLQHGSHLNFGLPAKAVRLFDTATEEAYQPASLHKRV